MAVSVLARLLTAFRKRVEDLEVISVGPAGWTAAFLATVAIRHLLELRSGRFPLYPPSAFYVHYVLAYLAPLLLLSLILSVFSSVRLESVLRLMLLAWGLTLLPPLVDTLVAGPHDAKIGYMELGDTPWSTIFVHFFDPTFPLKGTTPGIRVEALLACLLGFSYVFLRSPANRLVRSLGAAFSVYLASLFVFTLPFLFARALRLVFPGLSPAFLYNTAGRVPRPENLDVRADQVVLIYLIPLTLVLGAVALSLTRPGLLRRLISDFGRSEGWSWSVLAVGGAYAGSRILEGVPRDIASSPFDALALTAGPLSILLVGVALTRLISDTGDVSSVLRSSSDEIDEETPGSPQLVHTRADTGAGLVLLLAAFALAAAVSSSFAAFVAIAVGAGFLARAIPRVIPWAFLAPQLAAGIGTLAAFLGGYSLFAGEEAVTLLPSGLYLLAFACGFVADLPRALALAPRLIPRFSPAAAAAVPLLALLVPAMEIRVPISTGVIVVAVLFSFAALAASQVLPIRIASAGACAGAVVVLGVLMLEASHASAWRARALESPAYFMRLADHLEASGDLAAAAGALDEALRRDPSSSPALQRLGLIRYKRGDACGAETVLKDAVARDPKDAELRGNLASAQLKCGDAVKALATVDRALETDPTLPKLLFIRAQCLDALGKTDEASRAWQRYLDVARDMLEEGPYLAMARKRLTGLSP